MRAMTCHLQQHAQAISLLTIFTYIILCQVVRMIREHMVGRLDVANNIMKYLQHSWTLSNDSTHTKASLLRIRCTYKSLRRLECADDDNRRRRDGQNHFAHAHGKIMNRSPASPRLSSSKRETVNHIGVALWRSRQYSAAERVSIDEQLSTENK